jgi:hypothetical protein
MLGLVAEGEVMERKEAVKLWREVSRGAPDGVPTGRMLHEFAQRVEARTVAACDARHRKHEVMFALGGIAAPDEAPGPNAKVKARP